MIVVDTNVISELMRAEPNPRVVNWIARLPRSTLDTTTINQAEILTGIALLPAGRRRRSLAAAAGSMFAEDFDGRILSFDAAAANCCAEITLRRREVGRQMEGFDLLIAAIALSAGATVATSDVDGFERAGLHVVNPWDET